MCLASTMKLGSKLISVQADRYKKRNANITKKKKKKKKNLFLYNDIKEL